MITIRAEAGKYFFSDFINLSNGREASLDETILTFRQLDILSKAVRNKVLVLSTEDEELVLAALKQQQSSPVGDDCGCNIPSAPIVEYTEQSPLPPYDHPLLVMKESRNNKKTVITTGNDIHYPTTGAVIKYVDNLTCQFIKKCDMYSYALKAELCGMVTKGELSKYATKAYVDAKVVATETNLSEYYKSLEVDVLLSQKVDKLDGKDLSTHDFTSIYKDKLDSLEGMVSSLLDGYSPTPVMEQAISTAILQAQLAGADVDLSDYLTNSEIEKKLLHYAEKSDLDGLATETYVNTELSKFFAASPVELSDYAKKTEVESMVSGLVTQGELASELTAYVTSTELEHKLEEVPKLEVVSATVAPVLTDSLPIYTLGRDGEYILCTPDQWVDLGNGLVIPAYNKATLGL